MEKSRGKQAAIALILSALMVGAFGCQKSAGTELSETEYQSQNEEISVADELSTEQTSDTKKEESKSEETESTVSLPDEKTMEKLAKIEELVDEHFLFEADEQARQDAILRGYVDSLGDPYSCYLTAEEYATYKEERSGDMGTVGGITYYFNDNKEMAVFVVYGPAKKAGIMSEDVIIKINGEDIRNKSQDVVDNKIRELIGTEISLTIYRSFNQKEYEFSIPAELIEMPSVEYQMLENKIGYIDVSWFNGNALERYFLALVELKKQGMEGLIVDLRDNSGGSVTIATDMLDYMLPAGKICYSEDKAGNVSSEYTSTDAYKFEKPLVILVNGNSASASELFAGVIKDYGTGTIIGENTFGKGIIQRYYPLADGSAVKLTTQKWFTPSGNCIHEIGVWPDVEIVLDKNAYMESI